MKPGYIVCDTHAHLTDGAFSGDVEQVVNRAFSSGVGIIVVPGTDLATSERSIEISEKLENVYAAVGLHPHDAQAIDSIWEKLSTLAREGARRGTVKAVGETGLDFHYHLSSKDDQLKAFRWHVGLAHELGLPVIIHSRNAEEEIKRTIKLVGVPTAGGVLHCFTGSKDFGLWGLEKGLRISFSGTITFAKDTNKVVTKITPLNRTVIETDSPYLTPEPFRGKRNEPAYLPFIARRLASDRGVMVEDVYAETTLTARELFHLPVDFGGSITYALGRNLYINLTNRCTSDCAFCIRKKSDGIAGYNLKIVAEPTAAEVIKAIGAPMKYAQAVFCGFGEPTIRWDAVLEIAHWVKKAGGYVRLNTNGLGSLINGRDITTDMPGLIDEVSVSLNAPDRENYVKICRPKYGDKSWQALIDFIKEAKSRVKTRVSMVRHEGINVNAVRALANELNVPLKIRG